MSLGIATLRTNALALTNTRLGGTTQFGGDVHFKPGSAVDFTGTVVTGLIFPPPSFNDVTLTGITNVNGPLSANAGIDAAFLNLSTSFVSNPGGARTIWSDTSSPARPKYGNAESLALLSDVPSLNNTPLTGSTSASNLTVSTQLASPNLVLSAAASSPAPTAIWLNAALASRPSFGSQQLALLSDVSALFNNTTLTGATSVTGTLSILGATSAAQIAATSLTSGALTLTSSALNPGGANTIWLDSAALTRPKFGPTQQLALLSDVTGLLNNATLTGSTSVATLTIGGPTTAAAVSAASLSTPNVTLAGSASNPGGAATIWLDSASTTRPRFGAAAQLALLSDVTAIFNNATLTGSTTVAGPLAVTGASTTFTNGVSAASFSSADFTLTAVVANPGGAATIWLDSVALTRPKFGASPLALLSDVTGLLNNAALTGTTTATSITSASLTSGSVTLTGSAANPGGVATLWLDTTSTSRPKFGASPLALLSDVTGLLNNSALTGATTATSISSTSLTAGSLTLNAVAANPGGSATVWLDAAALTRPKFGATQLALLTDVAALLNDATLTGATSVSGTLVVTGLTTAAAVNATSLTSQNHTLTAVAANPGGTATLWLDSAALTRPKFGANQLALLTDVTALLNNATLTGATSVTGTLAVGGAVTATALTSGSLTLSPLGANPGAATTLWLDSTGLTRPKFGATQLALLSDIPSLNDTPLTGTTTAVALVTPNVTLSAVAANPGGAATLWLDSAALTRPKFGATQLALLSDVPSLNNATLSGATSVSGTLSVLGATTAAAVTSASLTSGSLTLSPLAANPGAAATLWLDSAALTRPAFGATQLALLTDVSALLNNATLTGATSVSGTLAVSGATTAASLTATSLTSQNHTLTAVATNPGGTNTLWLDSAALTRPTFGAAQLALLSDIPSLNNTALTGNTTAVALTIPNLTLSAVAANPGGAATLWLDSAALTRPKFGANPLALLSDVTGLLNNTALTGATTAASISSTSLTSSSLTLNALAANPGGATTIWLDSTATTRPKFGATQLALLTDVSALLNNATLTGATSISGALAVTGVTTAAAVNATSLTSGSLTFNSLAANPGTAVTLWLDSASTTRPTFGAAQLALLTDVPSLNNTALTGVTAAVALSTPNLTLTAVAANPGGAATLWLDSAALTRPKFGAAQLALLTDVPSLNNTTLTGTTTINAVSTGNLTLSALAANPGGATTIWLDSAALTRPKFGAAQLALLTDVPSLNNTTFTGATTVSGTLSITGATTAAAVTATSLTSQNHTLTAVAANPGGAATLWLDSAALTRPKFGATQLALLTDVPSLNNTTLTGTTTINAVSTGNLTLAAVAANPGGAATIWLDSGATTRPKFGATPLALLTDVSALLSNATLTGATSVTGTLGVTGLLTAAGITATSLTSPNVTLTAAASNPGGAATIWLDTTALTRPKFGATQLALLSDVTALLNNATLTGTTTAASLTATALSTGNLSLTTSASNPGGTTTIWLDAAAATRPKFGATQLALLSDFTNAALTNPTVTGGMSVTGLATLNTGLTLTNTASNPGGSSTLWTNSSGNGLNYGANNVLTIASASVANTIPVIVDTSGTTSTAASSTAANVARPLIVTGSTGVGNQNLLTLQAGLTAGAAQLVLYNTTAGQSGTGITFGQPLVVGTSRTWAFNTGTTTNDFWLWKNSGTANQNIIYIGDNGLVQALFGFLATRIDMTAVAANPGSTTTLWVNSAATTRPNYGATPLALLSDVISSGGSTPVPSVHPYTVVPTMTMRWNRTGNDIVVSIVQATNALTSSVNSITFAAGTIPAGFRPSVNSWCTCSVLVGGQMVAGAAVAGTDGSLSIGPTPSTDFSTAGKFPNGSAAGLAPQQAWSIRYLFF